MNSQCMLTLFFLFPFLHNVEMETCLHFSPRVFKLSVEENETFVSFSSFTFKIVNENFEEERWRRERERIRENG